MARLVLSLDGQVLAEYNMSKERYTLGRLPDNDIRIDNPAVSGTGRRCCRNASIVWSPCPWNPFRTTWFGDCA